MTTMATEQVVENPSDRFADGDRVRLVHVPSGESIETTLTHVWPGTDYGISTADRHPRAGSTLLHNGVMRSGEWRLEPLGSEAQGPPLAGGFRVGDRVRNRQGLLAEVIDGCSQGCNQHVRVRYTESGYTRDTAHTGLTRVEAAAPAEVETQQHGFRLGQRVRTMYGEGTVVPYPPMGQGADNRTYVCVKQDAHETGGYYGDGRFAIVPGDVRPLDEPDRVGPEWSAPAAQPGVGIHVGARVRVSNPAWYTAEGSGYVDSQFFGAEATVESAAGGGLWTVRLDPRPGRPRGEANYIHQNWLTVISGGRDESPAADTDEQVVRVGDVVEIPSYGRSGRVLDPSYRGEPARYDDRAYSGGIATVLLETGEETRFYGPDMRFIRHDDSPIAEIVNENQGFLGKRVWSSETEREGTVVTKAGTSIDARYKRSNQWTGVLFDGDTEPQPVQTRYLALRPDTPIAEMDDGARLRALQVMIHRVASYEAVRRDWCNEVNTALRGLGDLLPPELRSVNRTLGAHLRSNPQELFMIDQEVPADVDSDDYDLDDDDDVVVQAEPRTFDLTLDDLAYSTEAGYRVTDASVSVRVTVEPCDCGDTDCAAYTEIEDPSQWPYSDHVDDDQVRTAIREADLPEPSRYADFSYEDGDWTEV